MCYRCDTKAISIWSRPAYSVVRLETLHHSCTALQYPGLAHWKNHFSFACSVALRRTRATERSASTTRATKHGAAAVSFSEVSKSRKDLLPPCAPVRSISYLECEDREHATIRMRSNQHDARPFAVQCAFLPTACNSMGFVNHQQPT